MVKIKKNKQNKKIINKRDVKFVYFYSKKSNLIYIEKCCTKWVLFNQAIFHPVLLVSFASAQVALSDPVTLPVEKSSLVSISIRIVNGSSTMLFRVQSFSFVTFHLIRFSIVFLRFNLNFHE